MKKKRTIQKSYFQDSMTKFLNSFKNVNILFTGVFDFLFYLAAYFISTFYYQMLLGAAKKLGVVALDAESLQSVAQLTANTAIIKSFITNVIIYTIIWVFVIALVYALFDALIWSRIAGKRMTKPLFKKFMTMGSLWFFVWAVLFFIIIAGFNPQSSIYIAPIFAFLFGHFSDLMYIAFTKKENARAAVRSAFNIGITKLHYLILPYVYAIVILIILSRIQLLFQQQGETISLVSGAVIMLLFFAWIRVYVYDMVKDIRY